VLIEVWSSNYLHVRREGKKSILQLALLGYVISWFLIFLPIHQSIQQFPQNRLPHPPLLSEVFFLSENYDLSAKNRFSGKEAAVPSAPAAKMSALPSAHCPG